MEKKSIHKQISAFEPQFQQSLLLVYEHGLTYEQLAAYQNTTVSAVKSKLHRANKKDAFPGSVKWLTILCSSEEMRIFWCPSDKSI